MERKKLHPLPTVNSNNPEQRGIVSIGYVDINIMVGDDWQTLTVEVDYDAEERSYSHWAPEQMEILAAEDEEGCDVWEDLPGDVKVQIEKDVLQEIHKKRRVA